jgi:hypothetical protein
VGRFALTLLVLAPAVARSAPFSLELGFGGGIGYASRAGIYRDDIVFTLRMGVGIGRRVAVDFGLSEDTERIEPAIRVGARVRPFATAFWTDHWSPYLRGELAIVGGSHLGSNYDLTAGIGNWGRFAPHRWPWLAWFVEIDFVTRVGEVDTLSTRLTAGVALTTRSFWR